MSASNAVNECYDIVIVGGGPAGMAAAIYAARQGLSTAMVAGQVGGLALWAEHVENFIGWQLVSGPELVARFREHVERFDVDTFEGRLVNAIVPQRSGEEDRFDVFTREGDRFSGRALIIASGKAPNRLAVPGEAELLGRGVSYCATCDGPFFRDKAVAVVGSGESAADGALQLRALGCRVTLIAGASPKVPDAVKEKLASDPDLAVVEHATVTRILGTDRVTGVEYETLPAEPDGEPGATVVLEVEGVFIETGAIAAADFTAGLVDMDDSGQIIVDKRMATSRPGVYAAGDITDMFGNQIIIAAGQGAEAAMAAGRDLKRR